MNRHDNLDKMIKDVVQQKMNETPEPPKSKNDAWEEIKRNLDEAQHTKPRSSLFKGRKMFAASAVAVLMIALLFYIPQTGGAYTKLTEIIERVQGSAVHLFTQVEDKEAGENIPDKEEFSIVEDSEVTSKALSLKEARKQTSFTIQIPKYIPEGFSLKEVMVTKMGDEPSNNITLNYESDKGSFQINQIVIRGGFGSGMTVDGDDTQIESVMVGNNQAKLLMYKDDTVELFWTTQNFHFTMQGELSKKEIMQIAKSL